jgi:hypothetical protein
VELKEAARARLAKRAQVERVMHRLADPEQRRLLRPRGEARAHVPPEGLRVDRDRLVATLAKPVQPGVLPEVLAVEVLREARGDEAGLLVDAG